MPISRRNFIELCQRLTDLDEQAFEEVWRRLGLSVDWSTLYRTIDDGSRAISQRAFLRNLARGEAYLAEAPSLWDVTFQTAVAQAEVEDREVRRRDAHDRVPPPGRDARPGRDDPPGTAARVRGAGRPSRGRALRRADRDDRAHPAVRRGGAGAGAPPGRPGQGHRHRHGVHVRRQQRRDLVAGPAAARPPGDGPRRAAAGQRRRPAITSRAGRAAYRQLAGDTAQAARKRIAAMLGAAGDLLSGPDPDPARGELLREGHPAAGDRHHPAVVHPQRRPRRAAARGAAGPRRADRLAPAAHAGPLRELGGRPGRGLADQPAAVLRRADPGVVPAGRRRASPRYDAPILPADGALPVDPAADTPPGYAPGPARPAGRVRRGSGRDGHLGHVVADPAAGHAGGPWTATCWTGCTRWTCGRRPTRSSGPGCSTRCCGPISSAACCRGGTRRSPAGCWTRTGRRCPSRSGNVVTPMDSLRRVRQRRGPLLGRERPARRGRHVRPCPAAGRPPAGDQDT